MRIAVDTLRPQGERFSPALAADELLALWSQVAPAGGGQVGPATAEVTLTPTFGGVDLTGRACVRFTLPCDRCARLVTGAVEEDVAVRFERRASVEGEHELHDGDLSIDEFDGTTIDLSAWLAEQASLMLPEPLTCRPDCKGLCGRCGADLNDGPCACPPTADPRWAALAAMKR